MNACQCWRQNHIWESLAGHHRPITPINQTKHTEMAAIFVDAASVNEKIRFVAVSSQIIDIEVAPNGTTYYYLT